MVHKRTRVLTASQIERRREVTRRYFAKKRMREAIAAGKEYTYAPKDGVPMARALPIGMKLRLKKEHPYRELAKMLGMLAPSKEDRSETEQLFDHFENLVKRGSRRGRPTAQSSDTTAALLPEGRLAEELVRQHRLVPSTWRTHRSEEKGL